MNSAYPAFVFILFQELEREITFQGGSGLYYYYYKHMLTAPSFERGNNLIFPQTNQYPIQISGFDIQTWDNLSHPVTVIL